MAGETRQKILEATQKLIILRGMGRVTTKEIARELNLSEGALYRHFNHKEEIFFALIATYLPPFYITFQTHRAGSGSLHENLTAIALATMRYYEQIIPLGASFLADTALLAQFRETLQPLNLGPQNIFELVAAYITEEQELGRLGRQISALSIATLLLGPCFQGAFNRLFLGPDLFNKTELMFVEEIVQGLLSGILPSC